MGTLNIKKVTQKELNADSFILERHPHLLIDISFDKVLIALDTLPQLTENEWQIVRNCMDNKFKKHLIKQGVMPEDAVENYIKSVRPLIDEHVKKIKNY